MEGFPPPNTNILSNTVFAHKALYYLSTSTELFYAPTEVLWISSAAGISTIIHPRSQAPKDKQVQGNRRAQHLHKTKSAEENEEKQKSHSKEVKAQGAYQSNLVIHVKGRKIDRGDKKGQEKEVNKKTKHTAPGIRWWSPTQLLVWRLGAYLWESGRDPEFSTIYGRMWYAGGVSGYM